MFSVIVEDVVSVRCSAEFVIKSFNVFEDNSSFAANHNLSWFLLP